MQVKSSIFGFDSYIDRRKGSLPSVDMWLLLSVLCLLCLGLIMVTSASVTSADRMFDEPFHYLYRQGAFVILGMSLGAIVWRMPLQVWKSLGPVLLIAGIVMLVLVLIPGIGHKVNGSSRWLGFGVLNLQVSELVKLFLVIYLAGYLTRHAERVRTEFKGFLMPLLVLLILSVLLLLEPDFGATVVIAGTTLCLLLLAGVRLWQFGLLFSLLASALAILAWVSPYRMQRVTSFLDPWADPFNSGFQLAQSLIAFGRGEWFGVGLGSSVQKLFYLPEAHTDFLLAVLAEELGFAGVMLIIGLFAVIAWRAMAIAKAAEATGNLFGAYVAYGVGFWIVFQAYINIGVNMGVLPTKGITLPLMSYGGSSILVSSLAIALLLRVDLEARFHGRQPGQERRQLW